MGKDTEMVSDFLQLLHSDSTLFHPNPNYRTNSTSQVDVNKSDPISVDKPVNFPGYDNDNNYNMRAFNFFLCRSYG